MIAGLSPRRTAWRRTKSVIDTSGMVTSGLLLFTIIEGSLAGSRSHASPEYRGIRRWTPAKTGRGRSGALPGGGARPHRSRAEGDEGDHRVDEEQRPRHGQRHAVARHPLPDAHGEQGEPTARGFERRRSKAHAERAAPAVPSRTASRHSLLRGRMGGMGTTVGSGVGGATASLRSVAAPFFMNRL